MFDELARNVRQIMEIYRYQKDGRDEMVTESLRELIEHNGVREEEVDDMLEEIHRLEAEEEN